MRTRVGYAGGTTENPTYRQLGNHSETIQIDYDPTKITYQALLDIFWEGHNPTWPSASPQYASRIFYHTEEQREQAVESKERQAAQCDCQIHTEIVPLDEFYLAEDYHQKYRLKQSTLFADQFNAMYPDEDDLIDSTAAARVNGYLAGYGTLADLQEDLGELGLSPAAQDRLVAIFRRR